MSIIVVNLQDNRAVFRIFIALLRFSFDSTSYYKFGTAKWSLMQLTGATLRLLPVVLFVYVPATVEVGLVTHLRCCE